MKPIEICCQISRGGIKKLRIYNEIGSGSPGSKLHIHRATRLQIPPALVPRTPLRPFGICLSPRRRSRPFPSGWLVGAGLGDTSKTESVNSEMEKKAGIFATIFVWGGIKHTSFSWGQLLLPPPSPRQGMNDETSLLKIPEVGRTASQQHFQHCSFRGSSFIFNFSGVQFWGAQNYFGGWVDP